LAVDAGFAGALARSAAAGLLLAAFATVLAPASPAAAHDIIEATEPAGGAVLAVGLAGTALHVRRRLAVNDADGPVS
jgi:methionine-rich copper-binding protein CopC